MQIRNSIVNSAALLWLIASLQTSPGRTQQTGTPPPYLQFERLAKAGQSDQALGVGKQLLEDLVSKYPQNKGLRKVQKRLDAAADLKALIIRGLKCEQQKVLAKIVGLDMPSQSSSQHTPQEHPAPLLAPAEHLYRANMQLFNGQPQLDAISPAESKFARRYYDLRMQDSIEQVTKATTQTTLSPGESCGPSFYALVLPLLYLPEGDVRWQSLNRLFALADSSDLEAMSQFCLLRVDRPAAARAIASYQAEAEGNDFLLLDWSIEASRKCVDNQRPDLAEALLRTAIPALNDENTIVKLRLMIAQGYSRCRDHERAAEHCKQAAHDFPDSPLYARLICSYFEYLARQSKPSHILSQIDSALNEPRCRPNAAELLYLKWWALRKRHRYDQARKVADRLTAEHPDNECVAPVLLAEATDCLSNHRYDRCRKLLRQIMTKFPKTDSAQQAQKVILNLP